MLSLRLIALLGLSHGRAAIAFLLTQPDSTPLPAPVRVALVGDDHFFGNGSLTGRGPAARVAHPTIREQCSIAKELRSIMQRKHEGEEIEVKVFARGGAAAMPMSLLHNHTGCAHVGMENKSCSFRDSPDYAAAVDYSKQADFTVVMLGLNDAKESPAVLEEHFGKALEETLRPLGGNLVLADPPANIRTEPYMPESLAVVHREIARVAGKLGIPWFSFKHTLPARKDLRTADGAHLAKRACAISARTILSTAESSSFLKTVLETKKKEWVLASKALAAKKKQEEVLAKKAENLAKREEILAKKAEEREEMEARKMERKEYNLEKKAKREAEILAAKKKKGVEQ